MTERLETLSISELGEYIKRAPHTIRQWEATNALPAHLRSERDEYGSRIYTREQAEGIKRWLVESDRRPGKALNNAA